MKFNIALHWYLDPHSCTILHLCCIVPCEPAAAGHAGRHIVYRCFLLRPAYFHTPRTSGRPPHRLNRPAEATRPLSTSLSPLSPSPQQRDEDTSHHTRPRLSQTRLRPAPPPSLFSPPAPTSTKHKLVDYNQRVDDDQGYCQQSLCQLLPTPYLIVVPGDQGGRRDIILLITIRTLAIRLTILAFMLWSGPWPKAPSCVDVEKPTVLGVVVVSLGFGGCCAFRAGGGGGASRAGGGDVLRARNRSSDRMAMALTMSVATEGIWSAFVLSRSHRPKPHTGRGRGGGGAL